MKTGLVLEGGGMRGVYTVGVLDLLMDQDVRFDYVIGVSAGACNGASFVSEQKGRALRVNTVYLDDKRYLSLQNFVKTKSLFGMDFLFGEIPDRLDPYDYQRLQESPVEFVVGVTDVLTGRPAYFTKEALRKNLDVLRASSSIPVFSPPVAVGSRLYLDGGTSDPIPVEKALADGCDRLVVVLTRQRGFVKKPESMRPVYRWALRRYPEMITALDRRHEVYAQALERVRELEREGKAVVIAPSKAPDVGRFEKSKTKLSALYMQGRQDCQQALNAMGQVLEST